MRLETETSIIKEMNLIELMMTGEASRQAGCDRRTFLSWAKKLKIEPVSVLDGNKHVYKRKDAERVIRAYKMSHKNKGGPNEK